MKKLTYIGSIILLGVTISCKQVDPKSQDNLALNTERAIKSTPKEVSEAFKKYWYAGEAEITSYELEQARYGEIRKGTAALIYVTEPFLANKQVKADGNNPDNIPVLKLNSTKNYLTGIYPYSIMSSCFYPVNDDGHAVKVSFSSQEWCGHVYGQLNNRANFEITSHSYFESEADQNVKLAKTVLENELWNKIRINPEDLPVGELQLIPSFEYIRLSHKELKAYYASVTLTNKNGLNSYKIDYPSLKRSLVINFQEEFPYHIESWSESFVSGFGNKAKTLTSTAKKIKSIKSPYWQKNSNKDVSLRDTLGL